VIRGLVSVGLLLALGSLPACASGTASTRIAPAPILLRWPDPAFERDRQCRGEYQAGELERYLSQARLALWLPSTRKVSLDSQRRCITITVASVGGGRLAELVMRGVAVPRRAVLLVLENSEPPG
jgi:hypothetical protein